MKNAAIEGIVLFQLDKTSKVCKQFTQREFDKLDLGITVEQWVLLKIIEESEQLSQKELANKSSKDPASITRTLHILEKKGLVQRNALEGNRRQYNICLTEPGQRFVAAHLNMINDHRKRSIQGFSNERVEMLMAMLLKIQENMI